jgi:hypothetical protein
VNANLIGAYLVGGVFASCGGIGLVHFPSYYRSEVTFEANALSAAGTVVKTSEETGSCSGGVIAMVSCTTDYISTVEFQTRQGKLIEFTASNVCGSQQDCKNKTVQVQYVPSGSYQARIHLDMPFNNRMAFYIMFSFLSFLVGIGLIVIAWFKPEYVG